MEDTKVKEIKFSLENVDGSLSDKQIKFLKEICGDARLFNAFLMKTIIYAMHQVNADKLDLKIESEPFMGDVYEVSITAKRNKNR